MNLVNKDSVIQDSVKMWAGQQLHLCVLCLKGGGGGVKQSDLLKLFSSHRNLVPQGF